MSIIQVNVGEAFSDKFGSSKNHCNMEPKIPSASIIQKSIKEPIKGVTIIGRSDTKIVGPLNCFGKLLTPSAIPNPRSKTIGVTTNVYVRVNARAL